MQLLLYKHSWFSLEPFIYLKLKGCSRILPKWKSLRLPVVRLTFLDNS